MGANEWKSTMGLPAPGKPKGDYPAVRSNEVQGGLRSVANEAEMTQIPPWLRQEGMEVWVQSTKRKYRLVNNPKTPTTVLMDWKYINDSLTDSERDSLMTDTKWKAELSSLNKKMSETYVTRTELANNYLTAEALMGYFQTTAGMSKYVTAEEWQRVATLLSKVVARIVPPDIVRVRKGTAAEDLSLPTSVVACFVDGMNYVVPVIWTTTNYDSELVGYQILTGKMYLPEFVNIDDIPAIGQTRIFVQVIGNEKEEIVETVVYNDVAGFENPETLTFPVGTAGYEIELPATVRTKLIDPNGEILWQDLAVTWDRTGLEGSLMAGTVIYGEVSLETQTGATVQLSNTLKLKPVQYIKTEPAAIEPVFQYKRGFTLKAGNYTVESDIVNRIDHVTADMLYGVDNDPSQRQVEVRFMGLVNSTGVNITPKLLTKYPDGIRMPVLTSSKGDVVAFLDAIKSLNSELGYRLELEIPGGEVDPRIALDDEKHVLSFGGAVLHNCLFLIRRSKTVNLPYPDIC